MKHLYGCIDIGGTKVRMGLVNEQEQIVFRKMFLTPVRKPWEEILEHVVKYFSNMLDEAGTSFDTLYGIGIGCPGTFDNKREVLRFAPNLKWSNLPIKSFFAKRFPISVWLENDTNLSTLGVATYGEGKNADSLIGIFIGTGIGGGIILDNKLYTGSTGGAGEIGHVIVRENGPMCHCGNRGCIEAIASTRAIYNKISRIFSRRNKKSDAVTLFKENPNKSQAIAEVYLSGERAAVKVIHDAFHSLGLGMVGLINMLNPDMIVFGGGLSESLSDVIISQTTQVIQQGAMPGTFENVKITCTMLGEDAPIVGAAALVERNRNK